MNVFTIVADFQRKFYQWAADTFGPGGVMLTERAVRFIEEAIELVHAIGVSEETILKLVRHVYSKEKGAVAIEVGQAQGTLFALAQSAGVSAYECASTELERLMNKGAAHSQDRWKKKIALGLGEDKRIDVA